jgi:hypothetical protein
MSASQEFNRLVFQFTLPALVFFENRSWRRTEGAVIEKNNIRIQEKVLF